MSLVSEFKRPNICSSFSPFSFRYEFTWNRVFFSIMHLWTGHHHSHLQQTQTLHSQSSQRTGSNLTLTINTFVELESQSKTIKECFINPCKLGQTSSSPCRWIHGDFSGFCSLISMLWLIVFLVTYSGLKITFCEFYNHLFQPSYGLAKVPTLLPGILVSSDPVHLFSMLLYFNAFIHFSL